MTTCGRNEDDLIQELARWKKSYEDVMYAFEKSQHDLRAKESELASFLELFNAARRVAIDLAFKANASLNIDEIILKRRDAMRVEHVLPKT